MNTIIAGRFDEQARAEQAMTALEATGFQRDQIATFFVNPAGQHGDPERPAGESAYSERSATSEVRDVRRHRRRVFVG